MECKKDSNQTTLCNCTYEPCPRKGDCCACIIHHRQKNELPACYFPDDAEKTHDRSFEYFFQLLQQGRDSMDESDLKLLNEISSKAKEQLDSKLELEDIFLRLYDENEEEMTPYLFRTILNEQQVEVIYKRTFLVDLDEDDNEHEHPEQVKKMLSSSIIKKLRSKATFDKSDKEIEQFFINHLTGDRSKFEIPYVLKTIESFCNEFYNFPKLIKSTEDFLVFQLIDGDPIQPNYNELVRPIKKQVKKIIKEANKIITTNHLNISIEFKLNHFIINQNNEVYYNDFSGIFISPYISKSLDM